MKEKRFLSLILFIAAFSLSAQVKGIVLDSISDKPIVYAAVMYENSKIGVNTDENGNFILPQKDSLNIIHASNLGYFDKKISKDSNLIIKLAPKIYNLNEVVVTDKRNNEELIIGDIKKKGTGFSNGGTSHIWAKLFQFEDKFYVFKHVKEIKFITNSRVKNSILKLRLFTIDSLNIIKDDLIKEDIIITCKKGKQIQTIDISEYNIIFPEEGLMIGFENLVIEENKFEYIYTIEGQKGKHKGISYEPKIKGFFNNEATVYSISNNKAFLMIYKAKNQEGFHDISLQITLTN
ncbi:carboxypeptidase-like regulatory domain-containing protein [Flavobacterium sp. N2270]|uniref:carboxypeptidase-like regulatory domain-containing protein n=1 Tax=Flavobacterium sp. N2270 TaxID=2986831 RepID=UPI0022243CB9|nr:carboxypeptidase-like regulatory domain-containing protein [Flavobacterium sp. N2270]